MRRLFAQWKQEAATPQPPQPPQMPRGGGGGSEVACTGNPATARHAAPEFELDK